MSSETPDISVILLTGEYPAWAVDALRSLTTQTYRGDIELIFVHRVSASDLPQIVDNFNHMRMEWQPGDSFGAVRAKAVRVCRAPIVAFLEEHCFADPGWLEALASALEGRWSGAGGEPHNGNPGIGISDAVALMNFAPLLPPAERGQAEMIMGHNSAYKRDVLLSYGDQLEVLLRSDSVLNMKLAADGHSLLVEPRAKIAHANESTVGSILRGYFILNRSISATRAEVFDWSLAKKLMRAALWPLVPVRRLAGLLWYLSRHKPEQLGTALRWSPVLAIAWAATGLGQALGCLFGVGNSDAEFLMYETRYRRTVPRGGIVHARASVARGQA